MARVPVGILGCGAISKAYLTSLTGKYSHLVEVAACADIVRESAEKRAAEFGVPRVLTPEELLADPGIRIVANLTIPEAHFDVNRRILEAGKHVYTEKPLALTVEEGMALHNLATSRGLALACAPDTVLGAGLQTTRQALDAGRIGEPVAFHARFSMPNMTERYMRAAVGPLLDMGPYLVGALVSLLGPVTRVAALAARPAMKDKTDGHAFVPQAPARVGAALQFASGCVGTLSVAVNTDTYGPVLEIIGSGGASLVAPDPNTFAGQVTIRRYNTSEDVPLAFALDGRDRGAGIADIAHGLQAGRPPRLSAALSLHCLEVKLAILEAAARGANVDLRTTCDRPAPMAARDAADPFAL